MVTMQSPLDIANQQQRDASNPNVSTFVSASAGSGKTKLLTDRILRILLTGTPARKILCLTYTKAAAAEMAIRLNRRLGAWVTMPEYDLCAELIRLDVPPSPESIQVARQLLANILDLPGGMKISTIHSFCQSVLKRFPLEAQLSPHFEVQDENDLEMQLREAREITLRDHRHIDSIFAVAAEMNENDFTRTTSYLSKNDDFKFLVENFSEDTILDAQCDALGISKLLEHDFQRDFIAIKNLAALEICFQNVVERGTPSGKIWANHCLHWIRLSPHDKLEKSQIWWNLLFIKSGKRCDLKKYFGKNLIQNFEEFIVKIDDERQRLEEVKEEETAFKLANFNAKMFTLIRSVNQIYKMRKVDQSLLSYSDLISHTLNLVSSPGQAAWVLYKLDEGIDHLLLDEVQDTAPPQWKIIDAISQEFFNGIGARDVPRSIFAVGDPKQSIFSFQGSDLDSFETAKIRFKELAKGSGRAWLDGDLSVSFRSTNPILSLVDAVFSDSNASNGVCLPGTLKHVVSRQGQAGRISLWPITRSIEASTAPDWDVPADYINAKSSKKLLATQIVAHIKNELEIGKLLPSRNRVVTAGDYLILVRHRDELVVEITRACKAKNVAVAGLDRMILTEQQSVSDLLALCDSLLLPLDDLAFAQYLVSPLGGLSDESLMDLTLGRAGSISAALFARQSERDDWFQANEFFHALRHQVDFISPFALLALALGPLGGRAKLLRRLGPEAAEPIDELLAEAHSYAQSRPISLQQFVFNLRQSGATIKREPEGSGDMVRIMTVHGAKGLQAPIVILPDTTSLPKDPDHLFWLENSGMVTKIPVFCPHKAMRSKAIKAAIAEEKQSQMAEYNRLLYVALTRAEDELIVCGAEGKKKASEFCWHHLVSQGFKKLSFKENENGLAYFETIQSAVADRVTQQQEMFVANLPSWAGIAPAWQAIAPSVETTRATPIAPSRIGDEKEKGGKAASPIAQTAATSGRSVSLAKGKIIHSLLQHLPGLPEDERDAACRRYLTQTGLNLDETMQSEIKDAVFALMRSVSLSPLFGSASRAEIPLAGIVGDIEIGGLVDRLVVEDQFVMVADFKTDRYPPSSPADIPMPYLRQMAAYSAILRQIFPSKSIHCQLVWTENASGMMLPEDLLIRHAPGHPQPYASPQSA